MYGLRGDKLKKSVAKALDFVGLTDKQHVYPEKFSGGMKRRLNIACAIAHQPKLIIMDEPTAGIDPQTRNYILQSVKKLKEEGCTIIYTSHYMDEIEEICSHIAIIDHGKIIAEGTKEQLKSIITEHNQIEIEVRSAEHFSVEKLQDIVGVNTAHMTDDKVIISTDAEVNNMNDIIRALISGNVKILSVKTTQPDLETVFFDADRSKFARIKNDKQEVREVQPLKILRIALKELKAFRDPKILVFMLATPLLLMFILGTVLSNAFDSSAEINEIRLLAQLETGDSMLQESWESFVRESGQAGIVFEQAGSYEAAVQDVQNGRYTGYVTISSDGIEYYGSDRSELESSIVKGMLTAFARGYNLETVVTVDDAVTQSIDNAMNYVEEVSVHADRQPGAMDYYAITMTTLIILFSALTAGQLMESERKRNTAMRLLAAPVTRLQIFIGKIAGTFFLNALFVIIIVFFLAR